MHRSDSCEHVAAELHRLLQLAYIKLFNLSSLLHLNHIYGRLAKSLVPYMMSIHIGQRPIFLVRAAHVHGASGNTRFSEDLDSGPSSPVAHRVDSTSVVVARSAELSNQGLIFARSLAKFCEQESATFCGCMGDPCENGECGANYERGSCAVFTSTLKRAVETASFVKHSGTQRATSALNPIDKGVCYDLTDADFQEQMPEEYARWRNDVRNQRYMGGESYQDFVHRIEPLLMELEQQTLPVVVVGHLSTLQACFA